MGSTGLGIDLLGGFSVKVGRLPVPDEAWRRRKPAALVKILALAAGHRVHREKLMDHLWPELEATAAGANLRKAIHQARSALDSATRGAGGLIEFSSDIVSLSTTDLVIDVDTFRSTLACARREGAAATYRSALEIYRGELLPDDLYEEWSVGSRRELHEEHLKALTEVSELLEADGDIIGAIESVRLLVSVDPTREESHLALMRLYALAGRRVDALRQYDHLANLLDTELGVEPGAEVQRLREEINSRHVEEPELNAELWERVGDLRVLAGDGVGAAKAFANALDAGITEASPRIERKCAEAWLMQHRPATAAPYLAAAEGHVPDNAERCRVLRVRANLAWELGEIPAARQFAQQARELAIEFGNPEDLAAACEVGAIVSHFEGEWREGLESELERLANESGEAGELARVFDIHHCIGQYHLYGDGLSESVEGYARRILDRAEDNGAVRAQAFAWCLLGESLLLHGHWEESDGCLERSCDLHDSLGSRSGALAWQRRAELAACQGNNEVEPYLRRASAIATVSPMARHLWGRIYATRAFFSLECNEPEQAIQAVQSAAGAAARYGDCPTCSALLNPIAAEAFAIINDRENARYHADAAARVAGSFSSSAYRAMAETAAGNVARAEGDPSAAGAHFSEARDLYQRAGQPFWAERSARQAAPVSKH